MDLLTISPLETAGMQLKHPTTGAQLIGDDGQPVIFTMAGADSVAFRQASRIVSNSRVNRPKGEKFTVEQAEADSLSILVACVCGWSGNFSLGGEKPEFSKAEAQRMLESQPWIREQCDKFISDRANFLPRA